MGAKKEEREAFEAWWKHTGGGSVSERLHSLIAWEARAEVASLKDEDAFSQTVIAEQGRKIDDLTQQLAAAKDDAKTARIEAECLAASCKAATDQLAAAQEQIAQGQEGWKLVPIEPTEAMLRAMTDGFVAVNGDNRTEFNRAYSAMLAALTALPQQVKSEDARDAAIAAQEKTK